MSAIGLWHKPQIPWTVVVQTDEVLVASAACECGDDDCHWSTTTYASQWIKIEPRKPEAHMLRDIVSFPQEIGLRPGHHPAYWRWYCSCGIVGGKKYHPQNATADFLRHKREMS